MRKLQSIGMALVIACPLAVAEETPLTLSVDRLTMETASTIAQAAVTACRKQGVQISVAVVDRNGILQAQLRDSLAPPISLEISRQKAYTAANFLAATSALERLANGPVGRVAGLVMSAGGLPVQAGGKFYGAVGVSGAPSGETDAACAQAGIDAVVDDLEMSL